MKKKRVLIVDDEPTVTMTLAAGLEKLGAAYEVETASDGKTALEKVRAKPYALLITDYKMPGMSGLDLAQTVHQISPTTQIVLMTAYGSSELQEELENLGLNGYLDKPFTVDQMRSLVESTVSKTADVRQILILEDDDHLRRIFSRALRKSDYDVYTAATLEEAEELLESTRFDIFLCDVHIGKGRGTDLLREKSAALRKQGTQVVMISADARYRSLTEELGVEFYLEKPIDLHPLVILIDRLTQMTHK
ncbi:MAG: response regulator [Anaerolineales bacterium]